MLRFNNAVSFLIIIAVYAIFLSHPLYPVERERWVLAAEPFELKDVPPVYQSHAKVLPTMLLSYLARINTRNVLPEEAQLRKLQELEDLKIKYLLERNELKKSQDVLLLSDVTDGIKKKKRRDLTEQIEEKNLQIQEVEEAILRQKNEDKIRDEFLMDLVLWKEGKELYTRKEGISLARSLEKDGVSGLISGTIEDIGGYFLVSVVLDTGYGKTKEILFREAMPYDGVQEILNQLTGKLVPELSNRRPITVNFSVEPPEAKVFIDERFVQDHTAPVRLFAGEHSILISSPGFESAERTATFDTLDRYTVSVALNPVETVTVAFNTDTQDASVYFETRYFGTNSFTAEIPARTLLGEAMYGDAKTYFIYPHSLDNSLQNRSLLIKVNQVNTEKRIEQQRKVLYWSLGLLYCSLPFSMISWGIATDKLQAYEDGRLTRTVDNMNDVNKWILISDVTRGVSIALGVNFAFQLIRYLVAADQTLPKFAIEQYKE